VIEFENFDVRLPTIDAGVFCQILHQVQCILANFLLRIFHHASLATPAPLAGIIGTPKREVVFGLDLSAKLA
jgi:hypothetical protein